MSPASEAKIKELEKSIGHLQKVHVEQVEELSNSFSNRIESQFNLIKYLFTKYMTLKEFAKALARDSQVTEGRLDELWTKAKEMAAHYSIQDEMLEEYQKDMEK